MTVSPTISIIANFYNSSKFIPKLLKSVFTQSYTDWELICIDDCSPSNDHELIQKLTSQGGYSDKVKIVRNSQNLGISKAKKVGIDLAKGTYLTFIDGDDWLAPDALKEMIDPALKYNLDLVIMNNVKIIPFFNIRKIQTSKTDKYNIPIYNPELFDTYFLAFFGINLLNNYGYWGKLYKRKIIELADFTPPENPIYEDILFLMSIFQKITSLMFIDYPGYYWRWGGITSGKKDSDFKAIKVIKRLNDLYIYRKKLIQKYNYTKASNPLLVECKNVLYCNLLTLASKKEYDINVISEISEILKHPCYHDFNEHNSHDEFSKLIINKDPIALYNYCHQRYIKLWKLRLLRRIIHKVLSILYKFN